MIEADHFKEVGSGDRPVSTGGEKRDSADNNRAYFDHAFWIVVVKFFQVASHTFHNALIGGFAKCLVDGIATVNDPEDHCDNQYFNSAYHVVMVKGRVIRCLGVPPGSLIFYLRRPGRHF